MTTEQWRVSDIPDGDAIRGWRTPGPWQTPWLYR